MKTLRKNSQHVSIREQERENKADVLIQYKERTRHREQHLPERPSTSFCSLLELNEFHVLKKMSPTWFVEKSWPKLLPSVLSLPVWHSYVIVPPVQNLFGLISSHPGGKCCSLRLWNFHTVIYLPCTDWS